MLGQGSTELHRNRATGQDDKTIAWPVTRWSLAKEGNRDRPYGLGLVMTGYGRKVSLFNAGLRHSGVEGTPLQFRSRHQDHTN